MTLTILAKGQRQKIETVMNNYFEQEYARYMEKHKGRGSTATINVKDMARHFYGLALEDVKKEIGRIRTNVYACAKMRPAERQLGACMALDDIENFIDNQKQ